MREKEKKGLVPGVTFSLYHYTENFSCVLKNSRPKVEAEAPETALPLRHLNSYACYAFFIQTEM